MTGPSTELEAAVARDLEKRTGTWTRPADSRAEGGPEPAVRPCHNCGLTVELNENWECPTPGCTRWDGKPTQVFRTYVKVDCENCGIPRGAILQFNSYRLLPCSCERTAGQIRRDELQAEREALEQAKLQQHLLDAKKSRDCWEQMGRKCEINKLMPHCHSCIRFGGKLQGLLRKHERDQRAKDLTPGGDFEEFPMEGEAS